MTALLPLHVAAGAVALLAGAVAMAAHKGGAWHRRAGTGFVAAMVVLGVTAAVLGPFADPVQSPVGGVMVCYFVATGWLAARRRDAAPNFFDKAACVLILAIAAATLWTGVDRALDPAGTWLAPPRPFALIVVGTICALAGLGDVRWWRRGTLAPKARIARHLWRMGYSFFIATGSFFLGQMDVLPEPLRHLPTLLVLAFAPLVFLVYAGVRHRLTGYPLP
jgi:hypothetical protein